MKKFNKIFSILLSLAMLLSILPVSVMAADETKAVVEDIDWANWLVTDQAWSSLMDGTAINVNNKDGGIQWWCSNAFSDGRMRLIINDAGSTATDDGNHVISSASASTSSNGKAWGFMGTKYYTGWLGADASRVNDFPEDRWLGVKDISAHKDTGYAVFEIDSVTGDAANAYLAIKVAPMDWDVEELVYRMLGNASVNPEDTAAFPITPERYPVRDANQPFKEFYNTKVLGVKLTDYYDVAKGGAQTVAVPLSTFANSPDFMEVSGNATGTQFTDRVNASVDLRLFGGMGVAKRDSGEAKDFTAVVTGLAIVDPKIPEISYYEYDEESGEIVFEIGKTTDTDVTYKIKKTCGGVVSYLEEDESGFISDTIDSSKSYRYEAVAVDNTYGIESAPSEAVEVGAAGIEIEKANINWKDYVGEGEDAWHNYMEVESYYVGAHTVYNNYSGAEYLAGSNFKFNIDDHDAGTKYSIAEVMYENNEAVENSVNTSDEVAIPVDEDNGFWGYRGMGYSNLRDYPDKTKIPDEVWLGFNNINDYKDTGFAVFTINSVSGDAENAYLSIATLTDAWQIPEWETTGTDLPVSQDRSIAWKEHNGMSVVAGAKLTDYYDVAKGGTQTVAVPLSKLVDSPDFKDLWGKSYVTLVEKKARVDYEFVNANLYLFTGMGIARCDSGAEKTFSAEISEMKIVAIQNPANFTATEDASGAVNFTFDVTNDIGVSYKVRKIVDGVTTYIDAPGGVAKDTAKNPRATTTYQAVAYHEDMKLYSSGSEAIVFEPIKTPVEKEIIDWKNWIKDNGYESFLDGATLHIDNGWWCAGAGETMTFDINDSGSETSAILTASANYSSNKKAWGFKGSRYYTGWLGETDGAIADTFPADRWLGVKDISAYKDNGYAVFTIDSVSGDADNAYLAMQTASSDWDIEELVHRMCGSALVDAEDKEAFPITPDRYPVRDTTQPFKEFYSTLVTGVKLTDYYDVETGGQQTVLVPLSEFVDGYDFKEACAITANEATVDRTYSTDLRLFAGLGVARNDSASGKTFQAVVSGLKIVALDAPANFAAVKNEDGSVTATFEETFDKDVVFKVKKVSGGVTEYFDAVGGTYTDTAYDATVATTYSAVAYSATYDIEAESNESVTFAAEAVEYAKLYKGEGESKKETKYTAEGTMSASFFSSVEDGTGYIARYDANGKLLGANLVAVPVGEEASASLVNVAATDIVKVMFWANAEPIVAPIVAEEKPVKVLYLGSNDILSGAEYIDEIAAADGINMEVTAFYGEEVTIADFVANATTDKEYSVEVNNVAQGTATVSEIIADEWDYILVQEDIAVAVGEDAYAGFDELSAALALAQPGAELYVVNGWPYDGDEDSIYDMYETLEETAADTGANVIGTSTAITVLWEEGFDAWSADNTKVLSPTGMYAAGLVIYGGFTGADIKANTFAPSGVDTDAVKECL